MERQVRWFVGLVAFYQILVAVAVVIGIVAVAAGILQQNPLTFGLGVLWMAGGPGVVWLATKREDG